MNRKRGLTRKETPAKCPEQGGSERGGKKTRSGYYTLWFPRRRGKKEGGLSPCGGTRKEKKKSWGKMVDGKKMAIIGLLLANRIIDVARKVIGGGKVREN